MLYPVNRRSSSPPSTTGLLYYHSQTDAQGLYPRQNPRASNALFGKSNLQQSTFPSPPPSVVAANRSIMARPGLTNRPQVQRRTLTEPTSLIEAKNIQHYRTHQARHSVPTSPSREDSVRQTEPSACSGSAERSSSDLETLNFSPLTEANRMVATSVALSALMDEDEEADVMDIDKRIREVELEALAEHRSRPFVLSAFSRHTNSRSPTPPSETGSSELPAPIRSDLSAAAPVFQFKPKYTLPWEEAEAKKAGMDVQAYQKKQMFASQGVIFRPDAMSVDTSAQPQRTLSHSRSRSDIPSAIVGGKSNTFILNTPTQSSGSFAKDEKDVASEEEALALLPPPRSITPLPFKRPSFAEAMLLPPVSVNEDDKTQKRNAMPTLAEISARYMAARTKRSETEQTCFDLRSKRFSLDSNDSLSEQESVSSGASLPATPRKSRLPAFLQHRRSNSSSSDDIILYSPTKSVHFDFGNAPQTPQSLCPTLRVTPPSVESVPRSKAAYNRNSKSGGFMQVMLEDGEDAGVHGIISEEHERKRLDIDILSTLPTITCTPATAPGIGISPLAALEAQIQQNRQVEKRQERAQFMMSTLQRRNRGPGVAV